MQAVGPPADVTYDLQRRLVGPVRVLDDGDRRPRRAIQLVQEGADDLLPFVVGPGERPWSSEPVGDIEDRSERTRRRSRLQCPTSTRAPRTGSISPRADTVGRAHPVPSATARGTSEGSGSSKGVDPADLREAGEVGIRAVDDEAVLDRQCNQLGVRHEVAGHMGSGEQLTEDRRGPLRDRRDPSRVGVEPRGDQLPGFRRR
jgi:hypothetical protein